MLKHPEQVAVWLLFTGEPSDRALAGWDPGLGRGVDAETIPGIAAMLCEEGSDDE